MTTPQPATPVTTRTCCPDCLGPVTAKAWAREGRHVECRPPRRRHRKPQIVGKRAPANSTWELW